LFKIRGGVAAICGTIPLSLELLAWVRGERKPETFPDSCRNTDECQVIAVIKGVVQGWTNTPYPAIYEDDFIAFGCGRDYAIAAMHCGKSAADAVEIACIYENGCGMGIDVMTP